MKGKKIYIAGKITGMEEEARKLFLEAEGWLIINGFDPVNPMKLPHKHGGTWPEYMKEGIRAMMDCEAVYALKNWQESAGATIEINLARSIGMEIIQQGKGQPKRRPQDQLAGLFIV